MIRPQKLLLEVVELGFVAPSILRVVFESDSSLDFQAGQFLNVIIGKGLQRSYSIASKPVQKGGVELVVDICPGGPGSKFFESLVLGQKVESIMPLGKFVLQDKQPDEYLFVATGTGIAPLRSMCLALLESGFSGNINLLWGLRIYEDIYWLDEMRNLHHEYPNFRYIYCLSRVEEKPDLLGENEFSQGRVTKFLSEKEEYPSNVGVYVCGGREMLLECKDILVAKNVPVETIHYEQFY